jgi:DNA repair exonuclease SbcCD nuclease subunit
MHFIHTADWQIGRDFGQFEPDDAARLAQARLDAVARVAAHAAAERVDAVLVAGDVFDLQNLADRTVRKLFHALEAYRGPWIMIPGNHDAALIESVWTRALRLGCMPDNVYAMLRPGVRVFERQGFTVLAAPLTQRHTYDDATAFFDAVETPPGIARIGLAHGAIAGRLPEAVDAANPIAPDRAARARLDYLALGDWHGALRIDARTWYAGTPETDRFRNNESGQALSVRLRPSAGGEPLFEPVVEPFRTGRYRWRTLDAELRLPSDLDVLDDKLSSLGADDVVQLRVAGSVSLNGIARVERAVALAAARACALRADLSDMMPEPQADELASLGASGYAARAIETLQAMQHDAGADAATVHHALRLAAAFLRDAAPLEGGR